MKVIKKKSLTKSLIFSKICISVPISFLDSSQSNFVMGYRSFFFSLINPFLLRTFLKTSLLALETFVNRNYKIIFIANISESFIFNKFYLICKNKNFLLLKSSDISLGFLTNRKKLNVVIITLFLKPDKLELIQKETSLTRVPLVTFSDIGVNRNSSSIYVAGNYNLFNVQNIIITLLIICLEKKYESA
jgi:hypothetical protein